MSAHGFIMRKDQAENNSEYAFNVENAPEIAFKIDENKVKTDIYYRIVEETKPFKHEFDAICNGSLITYKDISTIFPWLSYLLEIPKKSLKDSTINFKKVEKAEIFISKENVVLNNNFKEDIEKILELCGSVYDKVKNLRKIIDKYGYFYARHIVFGGAIVTENSKSKVICGNLGDNSIPSLIESLKDPKNWKIIEYNDIHPIFDLLGDELKMKVLDVLGHRILKASSKEIDPNYDFSKNVPYVYPLANELAELNKITDIHKCHIFASISKEDEDGDIFSLRLDYINILTPQIVVHLITMFKNKKHQAKINWIIVGQPNYFDFNQTVSLRSSEHLAYKIGNNKLKVDIPKNNITLSSAESCILCTCVLEAPKMYETNSYNSIVIGTHIVSSSHSACLFAYDLKDESKDVEDDLLQRLKLFICSVDINESDKKYLAGQMDINWKESEIHPNILYSTNDIYKKIEAPILVNQLFENCEKHGFININSEKIFYGASNILFAHSGKIAHFFVPE
ncbi:24262_t:CDS:2 [Gigaspora margarita]|uniref:24262_t:CDS:1 n=1 Tax=Gigaspora margarita TaxID=4874 RepID=A0ABN7V803_GIGMA|nr:24262_t:CDS:2 [Gigaspora margarita]